MNKTTLLITKRTLLLLTEAVIGIVISLVILSSVIQVISHFGMLRVIELVAHFFVGGACGWLGFAISKRIFKNVSQKLDNEIEEIIQK